MRYKDIVKEPVLYVPSQVLPGVVAIPVSQLTEDQRKTAVCLEEVIYKESKEGGK